MFCYFKIVVLENMHQKIKGGEYMAKSFKKKTNTKSINNKEKSKIIKSKGKAKYDEMRQVDWSYFGPGYWD